MLALLASVDNAKIAYIVAIILFLVCAGISIVDRAIVWIIGFIAFAAVAFGLFQSITT